MLKLQFFVSLFLTLNLTLAINLADLTSSQVLSILGNTSGYSYEFPISNAGDVNKDGKDDILIGAYGAKESAFLVYGTSAWNPVDIYFPTPTLTPTSAGIIITKSTNSDGFASSVSSAGDFNGDGYDDIVIGAYRKNAYRGQASVIYGGPNLSNLDANSLAPASTGLTISSASLAYLDSYLGCSVSKAGKVNGDVYADIVVGISGLNSDRGAAIVVYGGPTTPSSSNIQVTSLSNPLISASTGFSILGNAAGDAFGISVSNIGDINKDGYDDIIVGAAKKASQKGAAYVVYGGQNPTSIDLSSSALIPASTGFTILGNAAGDYFGFSVSAAGDVNKDGIPDIIVGAYMKDSNKGAAYIIYGRQTLANIDLSSETLIPATTGFVVKGSAANDQLGFSVKSVGDINKDGYDDVIIGAPGQGAVHVIYGGGFSDIDLSNTVLDPTKNGFTIVGSSGVKFGFSVSSGDFDDDGKTELFVGTSGSVSGEASSYIINLSQMCADNCSSCRVPSTCEVCNTNYEVIASTLQCRECNAIGEYYSNQKCNSCIEGCLQCQDGSTCQVCADSYMLSDWDTCVERKQDSKTGTSSSAFEGASLVGSSLTSGSSLSLNFGLVAKILRNVKYLNITVSPELRQTFISWKIASGLLGAPKSWNSQSDSESLPTVFSRYNLESIFLINYWKTLVLALIGFTLFGVFKLLETSIFKGQSGSFVRSVNVAASNFALNQFYSNLDDVIFYLTLDIRSTRFDTPLQVCSFVLGVLLLFGGMIVVGVHSWVLWKYQSLKEHDVEVNYSNPQVEAFKLRYENISLLFKDFKDLTLFTQSYMLINLMRCLISSIIVALLFEYPLLQILLLLTLNILMIIFLLAKRSFKEVLNTCGQSFCEFILLIANICMFVMCIFDTVGSKPLGAIEKLSKCVIILNIVLLVGCVIFLVLSIGKIFYGVYQEKKKPKGKGRGTEVTLPKSTLNSKLGRLKINHPDRVVMPHGEKNTKQNTAQKTLYKWNIADPNGVIQQSGGMNHQDPSLNDSRQYHEISQGNLSSSMVSGNQVDDFLNRSNLNLISNNHLAASPQNRAWKPKRGRIKMPEGTTHKGYLDYQKRLSGGSLYGDGVLRLGQPRNDGSIVDIESLNNQKEPHLGGLQKDFQRRKTQIGQYIKVEKMREGEEQQRN